MAKESARVAIKETHNLPSDGKLYFGEIPDKVTIRAMTTLDEKIRLSTNGVGSFISLLESCIVEPENIDVSKLKMFDLQFLLYKLRIITYGSEYKVKVTCPECGKVHVVSVDLDSIPVNPVPDDIESRLKIGPLPVSGDTLECRILSAGDILSIESDSRRILNRDKSYVGDPEFILGYRYMIQSVNGEILPDFKIIKYIEEMHARDLMYFDSIYSSITDGIGLDLNMFYECDSCGYNIEYNLPINGEFFRPRYTL